jgi:hypothetical protein
MAPRASGCHVSGRARPSDEICRLGNVDSFFFHVRVNETEARGARHQPTPISALLYPATRATTTRHPPRVSTLVLIHDDR